MSSVVSGRVWYGARHALPLAAAALLVAACASTGDEAVSSPTVVVTPSVAATIPPTPTHPASPPGPNALLNPGFEKGTAPWFSLDSTGWGEPWELDQEVAKSGHASARLTGRSHVRDTQVYGVVQDIYPDELPEFISGYYRVDEWQRAAPTQYIQVVVLIKNPEVEAPVPSRQVRYILNGIGEDPFESAIAKFVFLNPEEPVIGRWVYFGRNVRQDFEELWGGVPSKYESVRLFFEARYENKDDPSSEVRATVYFDDLYFGPEAENPNRPE